MFSKYCEDFDKGRIRRARGRPKGPKWDLATVSAQIDYAIYLKLFRRWTKQNRRDSMLRRYHPKIDTLLPNHLAAAEFVRTKFKLTYGAERLLVKISEERRRP